MIEWTVNKHNLYSNPLLHLNKLKEIQKEKKKFNIRIDSLTCDYFMETAFFLEKNIDLTLRQTAYLGNFYIIPGSLETIT